MSFSDTRPGLLPGARAGFGDYAHATLVLLAFALFASQNLVHYPVALMGLCGLVFMVRRAPLPNAAAMRPLLVLFGCVWVPMLVALVDAVEPRQHQVQDHQIVILFTALLGTGGTVSHCIYLVASPGEQIHQAVPQHRIIFDHQNLHHHSLQPTELIRSSACRT